MDLRPELPSDIPRRIAALPRDRGYPVPWFVWFDAHGKPDFRIIKPGAVFHALREQRCWICGGLLIGRRAYLIGPMCAVNRTSAEPPSHTACADWSARACPFLARPHARRRDTGKPEGTVEPDGIPLWRNPGVALVWITDSRTRTREIPPDGMLFDIGPPIETRWYAEGRPATHEEVTASIDSGLPHLRELAEEEGADAVAELNRLTDVARTLVPA